MSRLTDRRALRAAALALPVAAGATLLAVPAASAESRAVTDSRGLTSGGTVTLEPRTLALPLKATPSAQRAAAASVAAAPAPLATFTSSFTYAKKTYRYRMVGSAPTGPARTTTLANTLTPLAIRFSDGYTAGTSSNVLTSLRASALYTAQTFPGGKGQYGDVFMRTQFWSSLQDGHKQWHVLLAKPTVQPALTLAVPADKGGVVTVSGKQVRAVDVTWFDQHVQAAATAGAPSTLTQLVGTAVILCGRYAPGAASGCGIGGYHSATRTSTGIHTYSFQAYLSSTLFGTRSGFYRTAPMSHELAEWLADPYGDNVVAKWTVADQPQYGCSNALEVGDPLVGHVKVVAGQPYQDEAYLSYFSRRKPSASWGGRYSWFGTFKAVSKSC